MSDIFVSYRRHDSSAIVGRLVDRLETEFGKEHVFRDLEGIGLGEPFDEVINNALAACEVLLVIIGPEWIDIKDSEGIRRLEKQDDWVRTEVSTAVEKGIHIIPVLVESAVMPLANELPEDLKPLSRRNAAKVRDDPDFNSDVIKLFDAIRQKLSSNVDGPRKFRKNLKTLSVAFSALIVASVFAVFHQEVVRLFTNPPVQRSVDNEDALSDDGTTTITTPVTPAVVEKRHELDCLISELEGEDRKAARAELAKHYLRDPIETSNVMARAVQESLNNYRVVLGILVALSDANYSFDANSDLGKALLTIRSASIYKDKTLRSYYDNVTKN